MRKRRVVIAVCIALLVVGAVGVLFLGWQAPGAPVAIPDRPSQVAPTAAVDSSAPPAAVPMVSPPAAAPDRTDARKHLQQRLDALALAYEQGDWRAAERAMWPNHAVVRPNGEHLERAEIREAWLEEWETTTNRDLKFYVEKVDVKGNLTAAQWTVLLTADLTDQGGEVHHLMINGTQTATLVGEGDEQMLDGAIVYTAFERKLDGNDWPTE